MTRDDNLFRLPDGAPLPPVPQGDAGRSDQITTSYLGLRVRKRYAQQALDLDLVHTATRHARSRFLDRDALDYQGTWRWRLTPRIGGELSAFRTEALVSFADVSGAQRIVQVTDRRSATLDANLFGGWSLLAGATDTRTVSSVTFAAQPDSRQTGAHWGVRYAAPSGSALGLLHRTLDGTNIGQIVDFAAFRDSGFRVSETELNATWVASGRSTLAARWARTERRHDNLPQRDFTAASGELRYAWAPGARLGVTVSATRTVTPFLLGLGASFRVDDAIELSPNWRLTEKLTLRLLASRRESTFGGAVDPAAAGADRRDVYRTLEIAATWIPHRTVTFGASVRREQRASTDPASRYEASVSGVTVALTF